MSPTQRSLKLLRSEGWFVAIVEKWNPYARQRQDLFGMFDLLAIRQNRTMGVQVTSGANVSARVRKLRGHDMFPFWCHWSGNRFIEVHGWRKVGKRGKRKLWECRRVELIPDGLGTPIVNDVRQRMDEKLCQQSAK